jgi:P27 family predicted phage terminase small subunit
MRGRKPKPTHLRVITGNPGKRPLNRSEPRSPSGMPDPPAHLSPEGLQEWRRLAADLHRAGLLSSLDRAVFSAYCQSYARWIVAEHLLAEADGLTETTKNGYVIQRAIVAIANKAMADTVKYAAELGMTPGSRSRVTAQPPAPDDDPGAEYFR